MVDDIREAKVKSISDGLYKLYKEYEIRFETINDSCVKGSSNVGGESPDELDGYEAFQSHFERGVEGHKSQLKMYLEEPRLSRKLNIDILQFWKDNQARFPQLALMARDVLSIPITSVASESSFSIGGQIISKYRSSLLSSIVEALLCTLDWLFDVEDDEDMEEGLVEDIEALIPTLSSTN